MKVKDIKAIIEKLDDNVELYYPHYYKGYGLMPVEALTVGEVQGETVAVFDWDTMLLEDKNFVSRNCENPSDIAKRLEIDHFGSKEIING